MPIILKDYTVAAVPFFWDPTNPNYSTLGKFDPTKVDYTRTGSTYLNTTVVQLNLQVFPLAIKPGQTTVTYHDGPAGPTFPETLILGKGG